MARRSDLPVRVILLAGGGPCHLHARSPALGQRTLEQLIRRLDCGVLIRTQALLLKRVEERVTFANEYLGPDFKSVRRCTLDLTFLQRPDVREALNIAADLGRD